MKKENPKVCVILAENTIANANKYYANCLQEWTETEIKCGSRSKQAKGSWKTIEVPNISFPALRS